MGIEHQLVNKKNKTYFDLDKGNWTQDIEVYFNSDALLEHICVLYSHLDAAYSLYVRDQIVIFLKNATVEDIQVTNDVDDSFFSLVSDKNYRVPCNNSYVGEWTKQGDRFARQEAILENMKKYRYRY